jgi:hypothetical protein
LLTSLPYSSSIRDLIILIISSPLSLPTRFNSLIILQLYISVFILCLLLLKQQLLDLRPGTQIRML